MKALKPTKLLGNPKPNTVTVEINHWNIFKWDTISKAITGSSNSKAVEIPYRAAFLIAWAGKSHTFGEELILPEAKKIVNIVLRRKACKEMNAISLSNNTL